MPLFRNANSYTRRNVLISSTGMVWGVILLFIALVVSILQFAAPGFLPSLAAPVWRTGNGASSATEFVASVFGNSAELTAARDQLAEQNLALTEENRTLRAENADLRALAGGTPADSRRILAGVLARPPVSPYDTLVVAAGRKAGVAAGAFAYGPGGTPIGTVASVTDATCVIDLFSRGGRVTEGWVGEKRLPITLTGAGGGGFSATLPRNSGIAVNDVVYVPGPGALPLGTVVRIDSDPSSPRDEVHIAPYVNLFSLTWVNVAP